MLLYYFSTVAMRNAGRPTLGASEILRLQFLVCFVLIIRTCYLFCLHASAKLANALHLHLCLLQWALLLYSPLSTIPVRDVSPKFQDEEWERKRAGTGKQGISVSQRPRDSWMRKMCLLYEEAVVLSVDDCRRWNSGVIEREKSKHKDVCGGGFV